MRVVGTPGNYWLSYWLHLWTVRNADGNIQGSGSCFYGSSASPLRPASDIALRVTRSVKTRLHHGGRTRGEEKNVSWMYRFLYIVSAATTQKKKYQRSWNPGSRMTHASPQYNTHTHSSERKRGVVRRMKTAGHATRNTQSVLLPWVSCQDSSSHAEEKKERKTRGQTSDKANCPLHYRYCDVWLDIFPNVTRGCFSFPASQLWWYFCAVILSSRALIFRAFILTKHWGKKELFESVTTSLLQLSSKIRSCFPVILLTQKTNQLDTNLCSLC